MNANQILILTGGWEGLVAVIVSCTIYYDKSFIRKGENKGTRQEEEAPSYNKITLLLMGWDFGFLKLNTLSRANKNVSYDTFRVTM